MKCHAHASDLIVALECGGRVYVGSELEIGGEISRAAFQRDFDLAVLHRALGGDFFEDAFAFAGGGDGHGDADGGAVSGVDPWVIGDSVGEVEGFFRIC